MVSPLNGARCPTGAHPGNTGGLPGRSGRPADEFKAKLEGIRDAKGLPVLEEIISGTITYHLTGVCEHCKKESTGPANIADVLKLVPSVDSRLRGVDLSMRYTVGLEKVIRLEGPHGIREAFEAIKATIRGRLAPDAATLLIDEIQTNLKTL
jgi:hypothetical protein